MIYLLALIHPMGIRSTCLVSAFHVNKLSMKTNVYLGNSIEACKNNNPGNVVMCI